MNASLQATVLEANTMENQASLARLFSHVVGDAQSALKSAGRTARLLEEQFITDGWPVGRAYGCEVELAHRYRVGRATVRETARILESRGTARMRRGRNGGLELRVPSIERLLEAICGYCHLIGVSRDQLRIATTVLDRVAAAAAGNPVLALYKVSLDQLWAAEGLRGASARDASRRTRAGQIVHTLMTGAAPGQWADGHVLGNEMELCERYGVDRGVLRQAIRILEAAGTATSLPGRGRGLITRTPGTASISRLICCHFAAQRVSYQQCFQVVKWLGVEMMSLAARRADDAALEPIDRSLAALAQRTDPVLLSDLVVIEEQQFALANNRVLDLFLRSAQAFRSWPMPGDLPLPRHALADFLECSVAVTAAIRAGKPVAAAAAQELKFARLKHNLKPLFENLRMRSPGAIDNACGARQA